MLRSFIQLQRFAPEDRLAGALALLLGFVFMRLFAACYHAIAIHGWW